MMLKLILEIYRYSTSLFFNPNYYISNFKC
jgi:hypothetical protein